MNSIIHKHIMYFCSLLEGKQCEKPTENIEFNQKNRQIFKEKFYAAFDKLNFKQKVTKQQFQTLLKDIDFLISYMQLSKFDENHFIFNNCLQHLIEQMEDVKIQQFIITELPNSQCKFNEDWTLRQISKLIEQVLQDYNTINCIEIIIQLLNKSDYNLEKVLSTLLARLQLSEKSKNITKIKELHPLVYLIIQITEIQKCQLEETLLRYNSILTCFRHFFRDIIRQYSVQQKSNRISEFIISISQQLPTLFDQYYGSISLINIVVNETINTHGFLQFQKKLFSSTKLKLCEILINISKNSILYGINFYFNFYEAKFNNSIGQCQLCLHKEQSLIEFKELENNNMLVLACKECYFSNVPDQVPKISAYQDQMYFPAVVYGEAIKKCKNWIKFSFEYYELNKFQNKGKKKNSIQIEQLQKTQAYLEQLIIDYNHLDNVHAYLSYYSNMSFFLNQLLGVYKNVNLILLAFLDDSSIQVRSKALDHLHWLVIKIKEMPKPYNFTFNVFETQKIHQKIFQRALDIAKQIRSQTVQIALDIWEKAGIPCLNLVVKRLQDIEQTVRLKTIKYCHEHSDLFKCLQSDEKLYFFEEVSKRLAEKGQIGEESAQLLMLLLIQNQKSKERDIIDGLLQLSQSQNNYNMEIERLTSLIDKLADNQEIIDKSQVLHQAILRLVQFVKIKDYIQVECCLKLISIITNVESFEIQKIALRQIDNIMEITSHFLENHNEKDYQSAKILNGLFKLLIFCFEEFQVKSYEQLPFPKTQKITNNLDLLQIFIEKIIFQLHPNTPYMKSIFRLSVLLDLKYSKNYINIYKKLEAIVKLIFEKSDSPVSFKFSLIAFSQVFTYVNYFITKCNIDFKEFFTETVNELYIFLQEQSQQKSAIEECIFAISKIWEKIPQLMFSSQDYLKKNLEGNQFEDHIIIAIYQIFYEAITDANKSAQNQSFDLVDKGSIAYLVKEIFNITFQHHIFHPNKQLRIVVLKLIECLFESQLTLALHFGDYLIASLILDNEIVVHIIKKCIEKRSDHMLMQFQNGITQLIKHSNNQIKSCFADLDVLMKNINKTDLISHSQYFYVCCFKLCDYISMLDEQFFQQKLDNYEFSLKFVMQQLIYLPYLSSKEIKYSIKTLLNRIHDFQNKAETRVSQLEIPGQIKNLPKLILLRLIYAYFICMQHTTVYGANCSSLRCIYQVKIKNKIIKQNQNKKKQLVQLYEINQVHISRVNELINSNQTELQLPHQDVSDSENDIQQPMKQQELIQNINYLAIAESVFDFELSKSDQLMEYLEAVIGGENTTENKNKTKKVIVKQQKQFEVKQEIQEKLEEIQDEIQDKQEEIYEKQVIQVKQVKQEKQRSKSKSKPKSKSNSKSKNKKTQKRKPTRE